MKIVTDQGVDAETIDFDLSKLLYFTWRAPETHNYTVSMRVRKYEYVPLLYDYVNVEKKSRQPGFLELAFVTGEARTLQFDMQENAQPYIDKLSSHFGE